MTSSSDAAAIARVHRRLAFGLAASDRDAAEARGLEAEIDRLLHPDAAGIAAPSDPFAGMDRGVATRATGLIASAAWLAAMVDSPRPFEERLVWHWHGHLVSGMQKVRSVGLMADQLARFRALGAGPFATLLAAVTTDAAMLRYLDGSGSKGDHPNENYARELLELFALGVDGGYTEADVQAGARALTGFVVRFRLDGRVDFVPARHDDAPQRYLGADGVHDVASVVGAVTGRPSCAAHVARRVSSSFVGGPVPDADIERFRDSGLDLGVLIADMARRAAAPDSPAMVLPPVVWLASIEHLTGVRLSAKQRLGRLRDAGQVPLLPPNVSGWPGGMAWLATNTVAARANLAALVASAITDDHAITIASRDTDLDALAHALGMPSSFTAGTADALRDLSNPRDRVALALASPEMVCV